MKNPALKNDPTVLFQSESNKGDLFRTLMEEQSKGLRDVLRRMEEAFMPKTSAKKIDPFEEIKSTKERLNK